MKDVKVKVIVFDVNVNVLAASEAKTLSPNANSRGLLAIDLIAAIASNTHLWRTVLSKSLSRPILKGNTAIQRSLVAVEIARVCRFVPRTSWVS